MWIPRTASLELCYGFRGISTTELALLFPMHRVYRIRVKITNFETQITGILNFTTFTACATEVCIYVAELSSTRQCWYHSGGQQRVYGREIEGTVGRIEMDSLRLKKWTRTAHLSSNIIGC